MGIEKVGIKIAETVVKNASATNAVKTAAKTIIPEFRTFESFTSRISQNAAFRSYSEETITSIDKFRKTLFEAIEKKFGTEAQAKRIHFDYDVLIQDVLVNCKHEKAAKKKPDRARLLKCSCAKEFLTSRRKSLRKNWW